MSKLTPKQKLFVEEYLTGAKPFNATAAAIAAGYSERTAYSIGSENLKKPEIAAIIKAYFADRTMSADEALSRLTDMARGDIGDALTDDGIIDVVALKAAGKSHLIKSYSLTLNGLRVEFHDPQAAIDKILRAHGAYVDRHEVTGRDGGPIETDQRGTTHGSIEHLAEVLTVLAGAGAIELPGTEGAANAPDDGVHPAQADA